MSDGFHCARCGMDYSECDCDFTESNKRDKEFTKKVCIKDTLEREYCVKHSTYEADKKPKNTCEKCWELWFKIEKIRKDNK